MQELAKSSTKLEDFPPKLRKLGRYLIENDDNDPLYKICDKLGLNYDSIITLKARYKNKYNKDFDLMLHEHRMEPIKRNSLKIYKSLASKAISGSIGQQKLVAELLGDIKNKLEIDHKVTGLFACFSPNPKVMPEDIKRKRKEMKPDGVQIIDIDLDD
ncbi:hypothetical protein MYX76_10245 [Desulfobacterota bacterium AH_259_B03_O07]|nr:hypothetical protein [Desulfobacterota bacterium AH_259_B03_O07]